MDTHEQQLLQEEIDSRFANYQNLLGMSSEGSDIDKIYRTCLTSGFQQHISHAVQEVVKD